MKGIPTLYNGILFRSRVEARWAAMFDLLGWHWEYEPIDLAGYIPDFLISTGGARILVEIKHSPGDTELEAAKSKIQDSGWNGEAIILRSYLEDDSSQPVIGWFGEVELGPDGTQFTWGEARAFLCLSCGSLSVLAGDGSWACRGCGVGDGNSHVGGVEGAISKAWAGACNRTQWRASQLG